MEKPHILIVGAKGVGKSTLIGKLLKLTSKPLYGYYTLSTPRDGNNYHKIYIHDAASDVRVMEDANCIGDCNRKVHNPNIDVFDNLGAKYIRAAKPGGIIVMDEIGFLESGAKEFTQAILDALDGDIPVIAAVKDMDNVPFLDRVRGCAKALRYDITEDNRDSLYEELKGLSLFAD